MKLTWRLKKSGYESRLTKRSDRPFGEVNDFDFLLSREYILKLRARGTAMEAAAKMNSSFLDYTIIDHTADLGIIVKGSSIKDLFILTAQAMTDLMVRCNVNLKVAEREVSVNAEDFLDLMVRWLGEILYLFTGEKSIVRRIEILSLTPTAIKAVLGLTAFDPACHQVLREIKAVTYHQISVQETERGWEARIIFDV